MVRITRAVYTACCILLYATAVLVLGWMLWFAWYLFVIFVLHGMGCNGACNGIGQFTYDNWWLIGAVAAAVIAFLLRPLYRWMIRAWTA